MKWTLVPRALHFNIMCGDTVVYEGVTSEKQGNYLADAHNAALAAERDDRISWQELYEKTNDQLAADREKWEQRFEFCVKQFQASQAQHRRQLSDWVSSSDNIRAQLAAVQKSVGLEIDGEKLLIKAIAAAQKPLVDALKDIATSPSDTGAFVFRSIANDALAKVKEGK